MKLKLKVLLTVTAFVITCAGTAMAAQWANPELLVDAAAVKENIDKPDWVVVDTRDLKDYIKGHIPGAISLGKRGKSAFRDSTARVFKDVGKYESMLGKAGIGNDTHVVFYHGDLKTLNDATVGFWVMEY
ncbi:MAG: rhodanese-like domain-containing protein, partial [Desulfobulbales bacterium]|nr:rhodanese-like domain-containing protein [Desulfobulbales bacterium]